MHLSLLKKSICDETVLIYETVFVELRPRSFEIAELTDEPVVIRQETAKWTRAPPEDAEGAAAFPVRVSAARTMSPGWCSHTEEGWDEVERHMLG